MTTQLKTQRTSRLSRWTALLCAVALGAGCAVQESFGSTFPVNRKDELAAALTRAKQGGRAKARQVVVGVTEQPRGIFAYDLDSQHLLFQQAADVSGVPAVAGPYAVVPEGQVVRVRQLVGGSSVLDIPAEGMHLVGADSDGTVTAIVLSTGGSMGARSKLVVLENGAVTSTRSIPRHVGGPAVLGGLVFVPHNRVHLSVVDARGTELARVQVREDVASQAFATEQDVYFGLAGMYRVDEKTPLGASGGAHYFKLALEEKLPGQPAFLPNTAESSPLGDERRASREPGLRARAAR